MKGIFITFEGPDGGGKTTQITKLANRLIEKGVDVVLTREPGGTRISNQIRSLLLNPEFSEFVHPTEVLLYAASRAQLVHEVIVPSLADGKVVLCDRYIDASIAYQSFGLGQPREQVEAISRFASGGLQPLRTYLLDVSTEASRQRLVNRALGSSSNHLDRIEQREVAYHERVRLGFKQLSEENKQRILVVNGEQRLDLISDIIWDDCQRLLKEKSYLC